jgi:hypothetical protein
MNIINKKYFKLVLLLAPLLIGLQSFLPKNIETILIYLKFIVLPIVFIYFVKTKKNILWFYLVTIYLIILSIINFNIKFEIFQLVFLSIFSSIPYYLIGKFLVNSNYNLSNFKYLVYGVNLFNITTLLILILISFGYIELSYFFETVNRIGIDDTTTARFALGNAIEIPFVMTCILFGGIILSKKKDNNLSFIYSTFLNLSISVISQSRIVIIISLFLFVYELFSIGKYKKLIFALLLLSVFYYINPLLDDTIFTSIIERFTGNDSGSKNERLILLNIVLDNFWGNNFLFGNGLTSSTLLIKEVYGIYRTVEVFILEILFELGIIGFFLIVFPIIKSNIYSLLKGNYRLALLFVYVQLFFFLPISPAMIFVFFLFGVSSNNRKFG